MQPPTEPSSGIDEASESYTAYCPDHWRYFEGKGSPGLLVEVTHDNADGKCSLKVTNPSGGPVRFEAGPEFQVLDPSPF